MYTKVNYLPFLTAGDVAFVVPPYRMESKRQWEISGREEGSMKKRDEWIGVNEAAELIGCTVGRVRQLLLAGKLEGKKIHERAWIVRRASAEHWARYVEHHGRRTREPKISRWGVDSP